jgi:hypothetical protein
VGMSQSSNAARPPRKPYPTDAYDNDWAFVAPYLTLLSESGDQRRCIDRCARSFLIPAFTPASAPLQAPLVLRLLVLSPTGSLLASGTWQTHVCSQSAEGKR